MIQVRCPECGFLQTLSEERFLTISEDFLNCPHCHARVPKKWAPAESDSVPEEARHKILAFSSRILNGGDVGRQVVYALESLVRHHGALESSNKALGMGYAGLGDAKKAEEFLVQAHGETPEDLEVRRCLTKVLLAGGKFGEALELGRSVMDSVGSGVWDEDVAQTAQALIGLGQADEARNLMEAYPDLDPRNPTVKKTRKILHQGSAAGFGSLFGSKNPIHKLLGGAGKERLKALTHRARNFMSPNKATSTSGKGSLALGEWNETTRVEVRKTECPETRKAALECWIYTQSSEIPRWDHVRESLAKQYGRKVDRDRAFKFLEPLIEKNDLTIDYIAKVEATDLFCYPEDLIPQNSRGLTDEDRENLMKAEMIVRIRLSHAESPIANGLIFMTKFVEAVRALIGGVVQDAASHILWGTEEWKNHVRNPEKNLLESQVNIQILEEGKAVWIHTHGMQKLGLPDLELEGIPNEMAFSAKKFMLMVAAALVDIPDSSLKGNAPVAIPATSFMLNLKMQAPDDEGHFPGGSIRIIPFVRGQDPHAGNCAVGALTAFRSYFPQNGGSKVSTGDKRVPEEQESLRDQFLSAHNKARHNLLVFKKSFRNCREMDKSVHAVKVGFVGRDGQYEWMWVALDIWRGRALEGSLENSPVLRNDLHKGSRVQFSDTDIFDWAIVSRGNILDGAFTEKVGTASRVKS